MRGLNSRETSYAVELSQCDKFELTVIQDVYKLAESDTCNYGWGQIFSKILVTGMHNNKDMCQNIGEVSYTVYPEDIHCSA